MYVMKVLTDSDKMQGRWKEYIEDYNKKNKSMEQDIQKYT